MNCRASLILSGCASYSYLKHRSDTAGINPLDAFKKKPVFGDSALLTNPGGAWPPLLCPPSPQNGRSTVRFNTQTIPAPHRNCNALFMYCPILHFDVRCSPEQAATRSSASRSSRQTGSAYGDASSPTASSFSCADCAAGRATVRTKGGLPLCRAVPPFALVLELELGLAGLELGSWSLGPGS